MPHPFLFGSLLRSTSDPTELDWLPRNHLETKSWMKQVYCWLLSGGTSTKKWDTQNWAEREGDQLFKLLQLEPQPMQQKLGSHFRMFQIEAWGLYWLVIVHGPPPERNITLDKGTPSSQGPFPVRVMIISYLKNPVISSSWDQSNLSLRRGSGPCSRISAQPGLPA